MSLLRSGVDGFFVLSSDEVESYHEVLGIDRHKLRFTPYKYNSEDYLEAMETAEGDFLYSGGDSIRDYATLFEAVRPLPVKVRILTHQTFPDGSVPQNVEIVENSDTAEEFYEPLARSMFAVIPILDDHLRSSGQGTYLGAMVLGKAVVVSDTPGARDLIQDGVTGLLYRPGDALDLRAAIEKLLVRRGPPPSDRGAGPTCGPGPLHALQRIGAISFRSWPTPSRLEIGRRKVAGADHA